MNMYVWENFYGTGLEFSSGLAVALANSQEEAKKLIIQKIITDLKNEYKFIKPSVEEIQKLTRHVEQELQKECQVFSTPSAVVNNGGS